MTTRDMSASAGAQWLRVRNWWGWMARLGRASPRRLRLAESLPLGDRRFVAVLEFDGSRFLLGGTASTLVLLARLDNESVLSAPAGDAMARTGEAGRS
jgi:flagellar biogenesis protein FliO